ncbi:hypothetical protein ACN38_g11008 [Penicillium nordicum]|uniref:Uncharacterized protein n=1 Tax=Penicillium nordicum TaxID=229535 RepID=A0A0N0RXQ4_9EURO|nr:hypothetical protein ACN38_g11008 [Penicillium nordicum]
MGRGGTGEKRVTLPFCIALVCFSCAYCAYIVLRLCLQDCICRLISYSKITESGNYLGLKGLRGNRLQSTIEYYRILY